MTAIAMWRRVDEHTAVVGKAIVEALPEILTAMAFLGGWLLLTYGVARLLSDIVWPLSGGLLLLSLGGWKLLWKLSTDGLYVLTRSAKRRA
jgi:hypothetical protein